MENINESNETAQVSATPAVEPTASPAPETKGMDLESILSMFTQGQPLTNEDVDAIVKAADERKRKLAVEEQAQKEAALKNELAPYEEKVNTLQGMIDQIEENGQEKMTALRKAINEAKEKAREEAVAYIRDVYNPFRQSVGLAPRNLRGSGTRGPRAVSGKRNSYLLEWVGDPETSNVMKITVKENNFTGTVSVEGNTTSTKEVEAVLDAAGVEKGTGGNARGLVNRIRKMAAERSTTKQPTPME